MFCFVPRDSNLAIAHRSINLKHVKSCLSLLSRAIASDTIDAAIVVLVSRCCEQCSAGCRRLEGEMPMIERRNAPRLRNPRASDALAMMSISNKPMPFIEATTRFAAN